MHHSSYKLCKLIAVSTMSHTPKGHLYNITDLQQMSNKRLEFYIALSSNYNIIQLFEHTFHEWNHQCVQNQKFKISFSLASVFELVDYIN